MTGNETITITIEDPDKNIRLSTLIERFDNYRRQNSQKNETL